MQHDLIIKNGNIIDGTGSDAYSGDIAIKDGLITEIGEAVSYTHLTLPTTWLV